MGGAESVVDVDVAEFCQLCGEVGIVLFFTLVEAEVFEQEHVAVAEIIGGFLDGDADAVFDESDARMRVGEFLVGEEKLNNPFLASQVC